MSVSRVDGSNIHTSKIIATTKCTLHKYFYRATQSLMQKLAYIRGTRRHPAAQQIAATEAHAPDLTWLADEHGPDDVIKMMSRQGRELIVHTLDAIAPRVADRNRVIDAVLAAGSYVVEASSGARFAPECRETIMAALGARRRDLSHDDAVRAGRAGGERGYSVARLEACLDVWCDRTKTAAQIADETGIAYTTLWRYFTRDRAVPVKRGRGAGRPPNTD